ncbi:MAG: UDP-N-acetylmuramoyl-tripeptide--D-alanyl-D-alanine ligase [Bryobacter sp.]|nr:UDP-N-acetylmuramoyl-tripeptide--D-alanyl-D-alanine ligase [Bryobacter sp.]
MSSHQRYWFFRRLYRNPLVAACQIAVLTVLAALWRRLLFRTVFVGITGSVGKTTAKDCLAAVLSTAGPTIATAGSRNETREVARQILRVRPFHRFAVLEVGAFQPGRMRLSARTLRPDIGIVLSITASHRLAFPTDDAIAQEKVELVKAVPPKGKVLLNHDDPLVCQMADSVVAPVVFFGTQPAAPAAIAFPYTAEDPGWPGTFRFCSLESNPETQSPSLPLTDRISRACISTQFLGDHWGPSFAAAYAAGRLLGVPSAQALAALEKVKPHTARLEPCPLPNGAVLIRDELKNDPGPLRAAARFLKHAKARRRVAVLGPASDTGMGSRDSFRNMARQLLGAAELYVLVGQDGDCAVKALLGEGVPRERLHHFKTFRQVHDALPGLLRPEDLVLLKARNSAHLSRLYFAQFGPIRCFREKCEVLGLCDHCPELK